jgi:exopolyphosphatase/guanosine-5'-triphosphate,3'-diphosphate pyrophosphatase
LADVRERLTPTTMRPVAVIDIGSNSIKILVATRARDGGVTPLAIRTIDARISAGISQSEPRLSEAGMKRGVDAVRSLLADAAQHEAEKIILVATSAVRDARNGGEFRERVRAATGRDIRILSGEEEANLIGRGLTCDPALRHLRDFYVFDLGGGSLECLAFRNRQIEQAISLQLGCVRLTEKFLPEPAQPFPSLAQSMIAAHTRDTLAASGFAFRLPASAAAVGTGGTVTTMRTIFAARDGIPFEATSPTVTVRDLRATLLWLAAMPLAQRQTVAGLPSARADVFPTALATLLAIADVGGFAEFHNSVCNLRYGLADAALDREG